MVIAPFLWRQYNKKDAQHPHTLNCTRKQVSSSASSLIMSTGRTLEVQEAQFSEADFTRKLQPFPATALLPLRKAQTLSR